jgi:hypothetical protein
MQTRSEEFHAQAEECQGLADRYGDLIKCQYEQLARQWLYLAAQAKASEERRNRLHVGKRPWVRQGSGLGGAR